METNQAFKFTDAYSQTVLKLEEEIAYFYGIKNTKIVAQHYMKAIKLLEENKASEYKDNLKNRMLPFLEKAYSAIIEQSLLDFDANRAASIECELIFAQAEKADFESICRIMINLYKEVFASTGIEIEKAALLRTFLYKYKIKVLSEGSMTNSDMDLLKILARKSEEELSKFAHRDSLPS